MKITFDIPDELKASNIRVLAGFALIAQKKGDEDFWLVKETHCNYCGECCMNFPPTPFGCDEEGKCNALIKDADRWICSKWADRPFRCISDPIDVDYCSITYRKVKV